ncbi:SurA N-terminal domain-containing protein [Gracilibacillus sp. YIM 98692]|uniref:SurA N-terminal domain-containing protein n=1 Tax=Gracilibacillus sp. YIM 98692 TaxID=2663532 RepID=UPI0013D0D21D|nr:SurA N-terminal domain-containing protein [Gracilibacillus sp. YIM 98692]
MKKLLMMVLAIGFAMVLAACNGEEQTDEETTPESGEEQPEETEGEENPEANAEGDNAAAVSDEELVEEDQAVVSVNGEEISGEQYNRIYPQMKKMMQQYGQDVGDTDAVKEQTISELVTQQLIVQDAESKGLEVTEEEINAEVESVKEEFGDQYTTVLESSGFTEESFKKQLQTDLLRDKYMQSELDVEVTDEEIEEYYNQVKKQQGQQEGEQAQELPELEEIRDTIEEQLAKQKQQQQLGPKIEELRENAEIEHLI